MAVMHYQMVQVEKTRSRMAIQPHLGLTAILLSLVLLLGCRGHLPLRVNEKPRTPPAAKLIGTLWWLAPSELGISDTWKDELDQMQALGFHTLVINGPALREPGPDVTGPDPIAIFFDEADRRGLSIFVDTLAAHEWWLITDPAPEIERARTRIEALAHRYGEHRSFAGWYIPYELYVMWDKQAELVHTLFREISAVCKKETPSKRVLISPFFILDRDGYLGNHRWATPETYQAFWTDLLRRSQVDIVALQDSGEHLSCYTSEQRRPFFSAMKGACDAAGKTLWANLELGELNVESFEDYTNRFGYKTHVNDPITESAWRGVPAEKLRRKMELAGEFTDTAISWGYQQFIRPSLGSNAASFYKTYQAELNDKKR